MNILLFIFLFLFLYFIPSCTVLPTFSHLHIKPLFYEGALDIEWWPRTVEPRSTDTRLIRTPFYNGQFRLSRRKAHIFSLKLTRLVRTPVNTDTFLCPESQTVIYRQPRFTDTGYLRIPMRVPGLAQMYLIYLFIYLFIYLCIYFTTNELH